MMSDGNTNIGTTQLSERLAILLGFSDGVDDVLENLLTIQSRADLLDYLVQLLGSDRQDQIRTFVDDVGRVRAGESLNDDTTAPTSTGTTKSTHDTTTTTTVSTKLEKLSVTTKPVPKVTPKKTKQTQPSSSSKAKATVTAAAAVNKQQPNKNAVTLKNSESNTSSNKVKNQQQQQSEQRVAVAVIEDKIASQQQQQQRGTPTTVCGCFGTMHPALNNCLRCGRISCEREGYDYCAFCGYMVVSSSEHRIGMVGTTTNTTTTINKNDNNDDAWEQKERLLQYDREFAQRTVVLDDQADYYNQATSIWLNDTQRQQASQQEQERSRQLQSRSKMKLQLLSD